MTSLNSTKESPSGGEKLLRLLASGATPSDISESKGNQLNQHGNSMPLNFAQVAAGGRSGGADARNTVYNFGKQNVPDNSKSTFNNLILNNSDNEIRVRQESNL